MTDLQLPLPLDAYRLGGGRVKTVGSRRHVSVCIVVEGPVSNGRQTWRRGELLRVESKWLVR